MGIEIVCDNCMSARIAHIARAGVRESASGDVDSDSVLDVVETRANSKVITTSVLHAQDEVVVKCASITQRVTG